MLDCYNYTIISYYVYMYCFQLLFSLFWYLLQSGSYLHHSSKTVLFKVNHILSLTTSLVETEISKAHNINFVFRSIVLTPCYICSVQIHHVSDKSWEADEHILYLILLTDTFKLWHHPQLFPQKSEFEQLHLGGAEFSVCHSTGWKWRCDRVCPLWCCEGLVLGKLRKRSSLTWVHSVTLDLQWPQPSSSVWEATDK